MSLEKFCKIMFFEVNWPAGLLRNGYAMPMRLQTCDDENSCDTAESFYSESINKAQSTRALDDRSLR